MLKMTNGDRYEAVHVFGGARRAIVNVEGAYVFVDHVTPDTWELSSEPACPGEELEMLTGLVKAGEITTITTTDPEGEVTTKVEMNTVIHEGES